MSWEKLCSLWPQVFLAHHTFTAAHLEPSNHPPQWPSLSLAEFDGSTHWKNKGWTTCLFWFKPPASNGMLEVVLTCFDLTFDNSQFYSMMSFWTTRSTYLWYTWKNQSLHAISSPPKWSWTSQNSAQRTRWSHESAWCTWDPWCYLKAWVMSWVISHHLTSDHRCKFSRNPQKNDFTKEKSHKNKNAVQQDEGFTTSYQWYILEPPPTQYQSPFSRIVPFSEGNPNLNLHLWLESWVGGRPLQYINVSWFLRWLPKVHSLSDTSARVALKKLKRELPGHVAETSAPMFINQPWMFECLDASQKDV